MKVTIENIEYKNPESARYVQVVIGHFSIAIEKWAIQIWNRKTCNKIFGWGV